MLKAIILVVIALLVMPRLFNEYKPPPKEEELR